MKEAYENLLVTRYGSQEMSAIFSDHNKFVLWRQLWIALAESEKELGLGITDAQIHEMKRFSEEINYAEAEKREKEVRHDVMAHVYAFGLQAVSAKPIIHLGATSCFVTDNADMIMYRQALELIRGKILAVMQGLATFADKYKSLPTLGFTHLQPAQLTTVGKRAALWLQDLEMDFHLVTDIIGALRLRGVKGTTGTQASFLSLLGSHEKVKELEQKVVRKMGFENAFPVTGQTYPRKADYTILSALSAVAQSAYKFAGDIRLLQYMKEIEEPFEKNQIGSSAMAYKRNPMRSERICALSRYLISLPVNAAMTGSTQWMERTLDDSANRRITMPQAFLSADSVLNLYLNICQDMVVHEQVIGKHILEELPFMATETVLMECVKAGGDRQELHEAIRVHSIASAKRVKEEGLRNDLIERLKQDDRFAAVREKLEDILDPKHFIGRAAEQTGEYLSEIILPLLRSHEKQMQFRVSKIEV